MENSEGASGLSRRKHEIYQKFLLETEESEGQEWQ